jgi:oxygen-independent coproporphyrinogen-3 oxidase
MDPASLYLHIPFCTHRCSYCDFNTYAGLENLIPGYARALCREVEYLGRSAGEPYPVHTIFFGGGTPSLLSPQQLAEILSVIARHFELLPGLEITLEANPGTISLPHLQSLRETGVNRLSLGMQSANPGELRLLERQHNYEDVAQGVRWARQAGFDNINLDLIFGLPYQSLESWQRNLEFALSLQPEHFSLYSLTLEHGTPMSHWVRRGLLSEPDPDLAAEMYEWSAERLAQTGFEQYEISNWARKDGQGRLLSCKHNLQYWHNEPYFGFGAGAHGFVAGFRTANVLSPAAYIQRCSSDVSSHRELPFPQTLATVDVRQIDRVTEMGETMMMGMRLTGEGVSGKRFEARFRMTLQAAYEKQIRELENAGLLEWVGKDGDVLRLTPRGRLLGNRVFMEFV